MSRKSISFPGLSVYVDKIAALNKDAIEIVKGATAKGAEIVADACKTELNGLPVTSEGKSIQAWKHQEKTFLTQRQKQGLVESMGLAPIRNDAGFINTKLGFDGYNDIVTKKWPKGQPNAMIARSVDSGSSAFNKNPFMRRVEKATKEKAIKAMEKHFDAETNKIMK